MTIAYKLQSKVQVIRNTAYRLNTQAKYAIGSATIIPENQPAAQIFFQKVPYMS